LLLILALKVFLVVQAVLAYTCHLANAKKFYKCTVFQNMFRGWRVKIRRKPKAHKGIALLFFKNLPSFAATSASHRNLQDFFAALQQKTLAYQPQPITIRFMLHCNISVP